MIKKILGVVIITFLVMWHIPCQAFTVGFDFTGKIVNFLQVIWMHHFISLFTICNATMGS